MPRFQCEVPYSLPSLSICLLVYYWIVAVKLNGRAGLINYDKGYLLSYLSSFWLCFGQDGDWLSSIALPVHPYHDSRELCDCV